MERDAVSGLKPSITDALCNRIQVATDSILDCIERRRYGTYRESLSFSNSADLKPYRTVFQLKMGHSIKIDIQVAWSEATTEVIFVSS